MKRRTLSPLSSVLFAFRKQRRGWARLAVVAEPGMSMARVQTYSGNLCHTVAGFEKKKGRTESS